MEMSLDSKNVEIVCFTIRPRFFEALKRSVHPYQVRALNGSGGSGCAELANRCVETSKFERVIVAREKMQPTPQDVDEIIRCLDMNYGVVMSGWNSCFFGIWKEAFRKIGGFDENFKGGGFEDGDYLLRCCEGDIGWCRTLPSCIYNQYPSQASSLWDEDQSKPYYFSKWDTSRLGDGIIRRKIAEPAQRVAWGKPTGSPKLLPWSRTIREEANAPTWKVIR